MNIKEHFIHAIQRNKISHAYILNGEPGAGKLEMAKWFAKTVQCEQKSMEPCGRCQSCLQADGNNHPDILYVEPEKTTSIGVDDIRDQINNAMAIKPYSSTYKVFIVDGSQKMTIQAQNALLKTLEEPPAYGIILLLTTNADIFLPTIRSRCVILNFEPVEEAVRLARNPELQVMKDHCYQVMNEIPKMSLEQIYDTVKEIGQYKQNMDEYLDYMLQWHREDLLKKELGEQSRFSYNKSGKNITAIEEARERIKSNVNLDLALEMMLFAIKERE